MQLWNCRRAKCFPTLHQPTTMRALNNVGQLFTLISCLRLKFLLEASAHIRLTTRLSLIKSGGLYVQWNGSNLTEAWAEGGERELNIPTNCNITGLNGLLLNSEWCISILKWMWLAWAPAARSFFLLHTLHLVTDGLLSASLLTACDTLENPDSPLRMMTTTTGRVWTSFAGALDLTLTNPSDPAPDPPTRFPRLILPPADYPSLASLTPPLFRFTSPHNSLQYDKPKFCCICDIKPLLSLRSTVRKTQDTCGHFFSLGLKHIRLKIFKEISLSYRFWKSRKLKYWVIC